MAEPKREPVNYRWDALNWEFLKLLANVAHYASEKYGATEQYTEGRLEGEKSPVNHMYEHLRSYIAREPYDRFDGDIAYHLAAIAYNAMIEFFYLKHGGPTATDAFVGGSTLDEERLLNLRETLNNLEDAGYGRGHGAGPAPGHNVTVVQEPGKTKFIHQAPPTSITDDPKSILSRLFKLGQDGKRAA